MSGSQLMIVLIVLIASVASIIRARYGYGRGEARRLRSEERTGRQAGEPALPSPREEELQREVSDLRERIKVLERIATDGRKTAALADEIESLRDR